MTRLRDEIGLTTVIDLRSTAELTAEGEGPLARESIRHHHLPLYDGQPIRSDDGVADLTLADRYFLLARFAAVNVARVLATVTDAAGPVVYHCAAGKDRTGIITAVLLGVLGVPDEVVVADYVATREYLDAIIERIVATESYRTVFAALPPDTLHAEAETMERFLGRVRTEYGGMRSYAIDAGVTPATLDRLAARVLE